MTVVFQTHLLIKIFCIGSQRSWNLLVFLKHNGMVQNPPHLLCNWSSFLGETNNSCPMTAHVSSATAKRWKKAAWETPPTHSMIGYVARRARTAGRKGTELRFPAASHLDSVTHAHGRGLQASIYKRRRGLGDSSWKLAGGKSGWEGRPEEEAEEELSEGGGGREEKRRRRRRTERSIEPEGR